jgi:hypothetical protein
MTEQFYGNRIKAGTILLNGGFRYNDNQKKNIDGLLGEFGVGLGLGVSEHLVINLGYSRTNAPLVALGSSGAQFRTNLIGNTFNVGVRLLPNTIAGFVQLYGGVDFFRTTQEFADNSNSDIDAIVGLNFSGGAIFWISTWMAITLEPFNLTLFQEVNDDQDTGQLDFGFSSFNPQFGFTFALGTRKPQ